MADPIAPITDEFIDSVIISNAPFDPNLNKTQGIPTRQLFKNLRDYLLQEIGDLPTGITNVAYADLAAAIDSSSLQAGALYRITDYQTTHDIPTVSPVVVNIGPVEPLIVLALANNAISSQAWSEQFPQDTIIYSASNTTIPGATKGCILERYDTFQNVRVSNDFRNVKYRRWKLAPVAFNTGSAYAQYATAQGADGGLYYVSKVGGFTAGAATTPSVTNDDWVQVFPNNNYHYTTNASGSHFIPLTSIQNPSYTNPAFPINSSDFVDTPVFQNYGTGFLNIDIFCGPGYLFNLVFFNDNQSLIARDIKIGVPDIGDIPIGPYTSTFVLTGAGGIAGMTFNEGMQYSIFTASGQLRNWIAPYVVYAATVNVTSMTECTFTPYSSIIRGYVREVKGFRLEYSVTPMLFQNIYFPASMGNLKFNTNAAARGWNVIHGLGAAELPTATIQSSAPDVVVDVSMNWRTFIGYPDFTTAATHLSSADLQTQINMAKTRHIIYAYEQPSYKSVIQITNGTAVTVAWQTDLVPVNLSSPSGSDNSDKRLMTYFTSHGNDFQVQQKDFVSGAWIVNVPSNYMINSIDGDGNITSVTFTPASGSTDTRIIIV